MSSRLRAAGSLCLLLLLAAATGPRAAGAEIVDRVLAVVDGAIITQSDVAAVSRLGLEPAADRTAAAVRDALIERRLILAEVDRYAPADPPEADVDRALAAIRARVGASALEAVLTESGGSSDQLRRYLRDRLRIEFYMQQRFGTIQPTEFDIAEYYRAHAADVGPRSLADSREAIVAALASERRAVLVKDWVAGLRRRANINVLPE
ncbi:MAG: hypothetical protein ABJC51_07650, partial [Acidobacteriota bacterium]